MTRKLVEVCLTFELQSANFDSAKVASIKARVQSDRPLTAHHGAFRLPRHCGKARHACEQAQLHYETENDCDTLDHCLAMAC